MVFHKTERDSQVMSKHVLKEVIILSDILIACPVRKQCKEKKKLRRQSSFYLRIVTKSTQGNSYKTTGFFFLNNKK